MTGQDDREEEKRTPEENMGKTIGNILKEKNTWNEPNKKVRNKREWAKFVHQ